MRQPRVHCPYCFQHVAVLLSNRLARHKWRDIDGAVAWCEGSGQSLTALTQYLRDNRQADGHGRRRCGTSGRRTRQL